MTWEAWAVAALVIGMLGVLATNRWGPDIIMMGVLLALLLLGILEPAEAVRGFASEGMITVALLYVVAVGMKETGATNLIASRVLGNPRSLMQAQARLVLPVTTLSAVMNNTPIVAMFLPVLSGVAKRARLPVGQLFLPLSYASILGGVCTLIGTSTNVVVAGLLKSANLTDAQGEPVRMGMFTIAWVGVPIAAAGVTYMLLTGRFLLPKRRGDEGRDPSEAKQYMTAMRVGTGSAVAGRTVEQAGLRHLPGLFLSRIDRADATIIAVSPDEVLREGDVLIFVGALESVVDLQQIKGLEPMADESGVQAYRPKNKLVEAVVSPTSPLVGRTVRESGIRTHYGCVVVAVHRQGHQLRGKIGDIRLRAGDTLLLEAPHGFAKQFEGSTDFYLVTERAQSAALRHERAWVAIAVLVALVTALSLGLSPMVAAMAAAGLMIVTRCCTGPQARSGIDWQVLVVIAAAFGIGQAMEKTGLAGGIAQVLVDWAGHFGPQALLAAVVLLTVVFTMVMTNNAAAVLMFPIAITMAESQGLNVLPFAIAIAVGASCEFTTPIGYQTNLMVMGPGGYRWSDYLRFGGPLTLLCASIFIVLAPMIWDLTP